MRAVDADVLGLSEVDLMPYREDLTQIFDKLGYDYIFEDKGSGISGSAILWKKEKM